MPPPMDHEEVDFLKEFNVSDEFLPYSVVIVDDEPDAIKVLEHLLKPYSSIFEVVSKCVDVRKAIDLIRRVQPDLVFLDIRMPGNSGIELAEDIKNIWPNLKIIFVSAYNEHLKDGYKVQAFDFITKPICPDELRASLGRFAVNHNNNIMPAHNPSCRLSVLTARGQQIIPFNDIVYIEYNKRYSIIYRNDSKISRSPTALSNVLQQLPTDNFIRLNKYIVVNINVIDVINKNVVELKPDLGEETGKTFIVGRRYLSNLKRILNL